MTRTTGFTMTAAVCLAAMFAMACGSDSPTSPSNGGGGGGGGSTSSTITIANGMATPNNITVPRGTSVTFVNSDGRNHEMNSDPHPSHGDCTELNQVGFLTPGQSRQSAPLNTARVCGFHDHNDASNTNLQGRITVQ